VQPWYQIAEEMKLYCCQKERELTAVTEQRDRLAEALREMRYDHTDKAERMAVAALKYLENDQG